MKTRAELDAEQTRICNLLRRGGYPLLAYELAGLIKDERAIVDREAQARAIRWAANQDAHVDCWAALQRLADAVERGEVDLDK